MEGKFRKGMKGTKQEKKSEVTSENAQEEKGIK